MKSTLFWRELQLADAIVPECHVDFGEHVRLVIDFQYQYALIALFFTQARTQDKHPWQIWMETDDASYHAGSAEFIARLGSMINHHGLLANLSLRENLLLPFLYRGDQQALEQATDELDEVANWLGLSAIMDQQAGERTIYTHALASLARCLLIKPPMIVAQEVHVGMSPDHLAHFRELSMAALQKLGCGLLYLTATPNEGSGLAFTRTLTAGADHESLIRTTGV